MSYKVLARKWRPGDFDSMLGQNHVVEVLRNSLEQNRLHHAYLFTGTRGVGKTTIARVFAKALSCEHGVSATPCSQCSNCQGIKNGTYVDLLEVDAASRSKVDETRDLLDKVQYLPSAGRYKIYLIDEVHMFSRSSFNALLKTLEEPPEHAIFLLATTEPEKLPKTVLSRCLQFNLSRLPAEDIAEYFAKNLDQENIEYDKKALDELANAADGSVRDGLSLLDQAIVFSSGKVKVEKIQSMLGTIESVHIDDLLQAILVRDADKAMSVIGTICKYTSNLARVLDDIADYLHRIAVAQFTDLHDDVGLHKDTDPELVQLAYQIAVKSKEDLPLAPTYKAGLEMAVLRMIAFMPESAGVDSRKKEVSKKTKDKSIGRVDLNSDNWSNIVTKLNLKGLSLELARNCVLVGFDETRMKFAINKSYQGIVTDEACENLRTAIYEFTGVERKLKIDLIKADLINTRASRDKKQAKERELMARESITSDKHVNDLVSIFDATLDQSSIKPKG